MGVMATAIFISLVSFASPNDVKAAIRKTEIPAQGLGPALQILSKEYKFQVLYRTEVVGNLKTQGVSGTMTAREALEHVLLGTGLTFKYLDDKTVTIVPAGMNPQSPTSSAVGSSTGSAARLSESDGLPSSPNVGESRGEESADTFHLVQSQPSAATAEGTRGTDEGKQKLEEIIVTAQKRSQRAQDVPVPLTVVDTQSLADSGAGRIEDYYATVPGMTLTKSGNYQNVTLRGLATAISSTPTVAMVIDDVPFGASTIFAYGSLTYPDIDPSDLARIEVLKGPQGTLYGADSLGGLIKVVTQDPSTSSWSGHVQMLSEDVPHGGSGYAVRGSINAPISDTLAVRASAFTRRDPGYIDNIFTGQDNVNDADAYGAHLAVLWRPTEAVSLKLGALYQNTQTFGFSQVDANQTLQPTDGDLQQTMQRWTGRNNVQLQLYTATLNAKLGGLNFVSVSGYGVDKRFSVRDWDGFAQYDITPFLPQIAANFTGVASDAYYEYFRNVKFSQEFRLSGSLGSRFDWLAGGFYTHEHSYDNGYENAADLATGTVLGESGMTAAPVTFYEYAAFGDLTVHITDRFDVQVGGRDSWHHQALGFLYAGVEYQSAGMAGPLSTAYASGTAFTYLVTPEFKISPDVMVYARVASGYRIGGPNSFAGLAAPPPSVPREYRPDTTTNYELGIKGDFFDHTLTLDASAYYIDWKNIQLTTETFAYYYNINGGGAKSKGMEASVQLRPLRGTTISAVGSLNSAKLSQDLPYTPGFGPSYGLAGDRLPYSIKTSGSLTVEQDIFRSANATGFVGATATYVGSRLGEFQFDAATPRLLFPAYTTINLHGGIRNDQWLLNLFVNNAANRRALIGGSSTIVVDNPGGHVATIIQPRTVGLSVSRSF